MTTSLRRYTDESVRMLFISAAMITPRKIKRFPLGQLLATPASLKAVEDSCQHPLEFLQRHARGDWGEVDPHDWDLNDESLKSGDRILSAYRTAKGQRIWIITEAGRQSTTILLPDEY